MRIFRRELVYDPTFEIIAEPGKPGPPGAASTVPGPKGEPSTVPGPPGESLNPRGEFRRGIAYHRLDLVRVDDEGSFVCLTETKSAPPGKAWQLLCRDGAAGRDGETIAVRGPRGLPGVTTTIVVSGDGNISATFGNDAQVGDVLYVFGSEVRLARADSLSTSGVVGVCNASVAADETGTYQTEGQITNPAWNWTPGALLYLSASVAGGLSETPPTEPTHTIVAAARAITADTIDLTINLPVLLSDPEGFEE